MLPFAPWVLVLALLFAKPNRTRAAWAILAPVLVVYALWWLLERTGCLPSRLHLLPALDPLGHIVLMGLAMVWLWSYQFHERNRAVILLKALALLGLIGIVGVLCAAGWTPSRRSAWIYFVRNGAIQYAVVMLTVIGSLAMAGIVCRKNWSPRRFCVALTAVLALLLLTIIVAIPIIVDILRFGRNPDLGSFRTAFLWSAGLLLATILPFLAVTFEVPLYRERFMDVFHRTKNGSVVDR